MSSTNAPNRLIYHQVQEYTAYLWKKKKVCRHFSKPRLSTYHFVFFFHLQDHRVYNRRGYGRKREDHQTDRSMGWTGVAKLVRRLFPTGFECEGHSLVNPRPEIIDVILVHAKRYD